MEATFKMPTHPLCKEKIPGRKKKPNGEPVNGKMSRKLWVLTPGQLSSSQSLDGLLGHPLGSLQQFSKKSLSNSVKDQDATTDLKHLGAPAAAVS